MTPSPSLLGSTYLDHLAARIALPDSTYERAKEHYEAVGRWLEAPESSLEPYGPTIYPQGSIALGTAIRPLRGEEHDVDAVCLLEGPPPRLQQQELKRLVGNRFREHGHYRRMLDPPDGGRRCWTLKYSESPAFHLDVLPAIPDAMWSLAGASVPTQLAKTAIRITDKTTWAIGGPWPSSNPKGFLGWFRSRMAGRLREAKLALNRQLAVPMNVAMAMARIPDYRVQTPLQKAVQILKHHRDFTFDTKEHKPISIIVTTLAAAGYSGEEDVAQALLAIVPKMRHGIERRNGKFVVANPVDPRENFADKWEEQPQKASAFFSWLDSIEAAVTGIARSQSSASLREVINRRFDQPFGHAALEDVAKSNPGPRTSGIVASSVLLPSKSPGVSHPNVTIPSRPSRPWRLP